MADKPDAAEVLGSGAAVAALLEPLELLLLPGSGIAAVEDAVRLLLLPLLLLADEVEG